MSRSTKDWFDSYLQYTSEDEPCKLYRKWVAVSTIAAALQRKVYHRMARKTFYPNFYIALVGPSGCRKSTAIDVESDILQEVGIEVAADVTSKEKLISRLEKIGKAEGEEGGLERLTMQTLDMPVLPHSSLTAVADELIVFLPAYDPDYAGYLNKLYDCKDVFRYETLKRGDQIVENVWFNIIGGITPETLKGRLTSEFVDIGLPGRIIFVNSHDKPIRRGYQIDTAENRKLRTKLVRDLRTILMMAGPFKPTPEWLESYLPWYEQEDLEHPFQELPALAPYANRRGSYIHKLSMVFSASRNDRMTIKREDFERSVELLAEAEKTMPDALGAVGANEAGRAVDSVVLHMKNVPKIRFNQLLSRFLYTIDEQTLLRIVATLEKVGKVKLTKVSVIHPETKKVTQDIMIRYIREGD